MAELEDEAGEMRVQGEGKLKIKRGLGFRKAMLGRAALEGPLSDLGQNSDTAGQAVAAACWRRGTWPLGRVCLLDPTLCGRRKAETGEGAGG